MGAINLSAVEKWYGAVQVIKGVDLEIQDGEFIVFVGPSGCGKSTLLRMIGGLEDISRGKMFIDEKDVTDQPPSRQANGSPRSSANLASCSSKCALSTTLSSASIAVSAAGRCRSGGAPGSWTPRNSWRGSHRNRGRPLVRSRTPAPGDQPQSRPAGP